MKTIRPILLCLLLCLSLTACGGQETAPATDDQLTPDPAAIALTALREAAQDEGAACAVAYLGILPDGDASAYEDMLTEFGYSREEYPYLWDVPQERIAQNAGTEAYCIVPADPGTTILVQTCDYDDEGLPVYGKTLYERKGAPAVVVGNVSDILPNLMVTATGADGTVLMTWSPSLSLCDGTLALPVEGAYDFTRPEVYGHGVEVPTVDFLGTWQNEDCRLVFMDDYSLTFHVETAIDPAVDFTGTWYVITDSAQYPEGSVVLDLRQVGGSDHDRYGIFSLTVRDGALTLTPVSGDALPLYDIGGPVTLQRG